MEPTSEAVIEELRKSYPDGLPAQAPQAVAVILRAQKSDTIAEIIHFNQTMYMVGNLANRGDKIMQDVLRLTENISLAINHLMKETRTNVS